MIHQSKQSPIASSEDPDHMAIDGDYGGPVLYTYSILYTVDNFNPLNAG